MEVDMKPAVPTISAASASGRGCGEFTEDDLAAADQLVQLSVSGGGDDEEGPEVCSSSSLSARSVNNAEAAKAGEDEEEGMVDRRARKRYRLVSELYAATRQVKADVGGGSGGGTKRKSKVAVEN